MGLISQGIVVGKTIRNVNRLREIVTVFAKNGFDEFINLGVTSKIPNFVLPQSKIKIKDELKQKQELDWPSILGFRLRQCFEELGPAFVKMGQLLSTREDIFEAGFIDEMKLLRDKVKAVPIEQSKEIIERNLKGKIEEIFKHFNPIPIGTASIGVVYEAVLKNGDEVVVKVRRPNIQKIIETDFSLMLFIVSQVERASSEIKYLGLQKVLNDFGAALINELNFQFEALNAERLRSNMLKHKDSEIFYIPAIYKEYLTSEIMVMEKLKGIPFSSPLIIEKIDAVLVEKLNLAIEVFVKTFLQDGFFHADLHGGNFFYLPDGKIGIIDFGLVGSLGKKSRINFLAIIYALLTFNYENLVYEFLDVAEYENMPNINTLILDVRSALAPHVGLTVKQINFSHLNLIILKTLSKHKVFLPRDWYVVFRAFIALDGVGRSLGLDFDIFGIFEKNIQEIINNNFNKDQVGEELVWIARDILPIMRALPRHLKWFLKDWLNNGFSFKVTHQGLDDNFKKIQNAIVFLSFSILVSVFFFAGVNLIGNKTVYHPADVPFLTWIFWIMAGTFFLRSLPFLKR